MLYNKAQGAFVLDINSPNARVATISEIRNKLKETFDQAQERVVYVVSNNQKLGAVLGPKHLELLEEALEREAEARMLAVAEARLKSLRDGDSDLLDEDEFWGEKAKKTNR